MVSLKLLLPLVAQDSNLEEPSFGNRHAVDNRQWSLHSLIAHAGFLLRLREIQERKVLFKHDLVGGPQALKRKVKAEADDHRTARDRV